MKISKFLTIALFALITASLFMASCSKHHIPRTKYRGMPPRGPRG